MQASALCLPKTTTVALHHEGQQHSEERQVNKQLLGPVGCLSSAITGKKNIFETDVSQVEFRMKAHLNNWRMDSKKSMCGI